MLEIGLEFARGILFIRLKGRLDTNDCQELNDCLDKMINEKGLKYFILNLEELSYIDEKGIKIIVDRYFDVVLHDGKLVICGFVDKYLKNIEIKNIFNSIEHTSNELTALKLINI